MPSQPAVTIWRTFGLALFLVCAVSVIWQARRGLTGDEPGYLLAAQSLIQDHDVDLLNNYRRETYRSFYPKPLYENFSPSSPPGHEYPLLPIGLSLLVLPGFWLAGRLGAVWTISALGAFAIVTLDRLYRRTYEAKLDKWFWLLFFTLPFFAYISTIFTELPALALIYWVVTELLTGRALTNRRATLVGLAIGLLYPLHYKYALEVGVLLLLVCTQAYHRRIRLSQLSLIVGIVGLIGLATSIYFQRLYGSWLPWRGIYPIEPMELRHLFQGVVGLFLSRGFGLIWYFPLLVLAPAGFVALWRRNQMVTGWFLALTAIVILFNGLNAPLIGYAPVGRLLMPIAPILLFAVYILRPVMPRLWTMLFAWSLINSLVILIVPQLAYTTGENRLYWAYGRLFHLDLSQLFPALNGIIDNGTGWLPWTPLAIIQTAAWLVVIGGLNWWLIRQVRFADNQQV